MVSPVLTTKFFIPQPSPNLVPRPRLIEKLNQGLDSKLILVSAPAGFGKSTLLSEWVTGLDKPVTWLTLDKNDNRLRRFLTYLIVALQNIDKTFGEGMVPALETSDSPPVDSILSTLINQIALSPNDILIVLDDYHHITNQSIHQSLDFLLENLPPNVRIVIISRVDPPFKLSRLRASGHMVDIRSEDLRFNQLEVFEFLNDTNGLDLSPSEIETLLSRTEGWIAGLQLAALSLRDRQDKKEFVADFSGTHHYIIDYLVDEVMSRQPEEIRSFLRRTSILDHFNASLCNAVLECSNSKQILNDIDEANIFLIPLDDQHSWYRYHQLFADFLSVELHEVEPEIVLELHRRAAQWLEDEEILIEAIHHALTGKNYHHAANMIERIGPDMILHNEFDQLAEWLDQIPQELVENRPWLCIIRAWLHDRWAQIGIGEKYLQLAESAIDSEIYSVPEQGNLIRGHAAAIRALFSLQRGQIKKSIEQSNQALALLPEDYFIRCSAFLTLGWAKRALGDLPGAIRTQVEGHRASLMVGNQILAQVTKLEIGMIQYYQGHLQQAFETLQETARLTYEKSGIRIPYASSASIWAGIILAEWNDLEAALPYIQDGIEIGKSSKLVNWVATGYAELTLVYLAQGDLENASHAGREAEKIFTQTPDLGLEIRTWVINSRVRLLLAQNKFNEALDFLRYNGLTTDDEISFLTEFRELILARVLIHIGSGDPSAQQLVDANRILNKILELAKPAGYITTAIEALVLQALTYDAQGERERALHSLEQALLLAQPEGYVRTFVNEGEPMRRLLAQFEGNKKIRAYVAKLLSAFVQSDFSPSAKTPQPLVEPLSERELEVLKLLATELSGPEIAQELIISIHTMRTHTKNIYSKLGVNNRRSAVRKAKEFNLI